jgi:hypothetical protein
MTAEAILPFSMMTVASMSPWRDVPQPENVPSLYAGAAGVGDGVGVGDAAGDGSGVTAGAGVGDAEGDNSGVGLGVGSAVFAAGAGDAARMPVAGVAVGFGVAGGAALVALVALVVLVVLGMTIRARSAANSLSAAARVRR